MEIDVRSAWEAALVAALRARGPVLLDDVPSAAGLAWPLALTTVDRLSRIGTVRLRRIGPAYLVSLPDDGWTAPGSRAAGYEPSEAA